MTRAGFSLPAEKTWSDFIVDRTRMMRLINDLPAGKYTLTVERMARRGVQQRKYYFAVVVKAFSEYWGTDDEDTHELLKEHCNSKTVELVDKHTGEVIEKTFGGSTAGFNTQQWTDYIERCQRWGATEFGFVIPDPDPEWTFNKKGPTLERRPQGGKQTHEQYSA